MTHCPTAQTHDANHACSLARRGPPSLSPTTTTRGRATRCSVDALRLRASEMGCSRCMTLGSTRQHAGPRCVAEPATSQTHDAQHACSLARRGPVAHDHHAGVPLDARSMHCGCARVRWAAHAAWHSAAPASAPAHGALLTHGSNTRRQETRAALLAVGLPLSPTTTTWACHSMLDRCTAAARE